MTFVELFDIEQNMDKTRAAKKKQHTKLKTIDRNKIINSFAGKVQ